MYENSNSVPSSVALISVRSINSTTPGTTFGALLTYGFYQLFEDQVKLFTHDATLQVCKPCGSNEYIKFLAVASQHLILGLHILHNSAGDDT